MPTGTRSRRSRRRRSPTPRREGRRRRRGGRQQRPSPPAALAVRELSRGAPACTGRQRARPGRLLAGLLEPGQDLQRHRRSRPEIVSTFPRDLTAGVKECAEQGYSICGPSEYGLQAEGTSFAAPQVSAAAAHLLALRPSLRPEQVTALLKRNGPTSTQRPGAGHAHSGATRSPAGGGSTSPRRCASSGQIPARDRSSRTTMRAAAAPLWGRRSGSSKARLLGRPERRLRDPAPPRAARSTPACADRRHRHEPHRVAPGREEHRRLRLARPSGRQSARPGAREYLSYRPGGGIYYVQVKLGSRGAAATS